MPWVFPPGGPIKHAYFWTEKCSFSSGFDLLGEVRDVIRTFCMIDVGRRKSRCAEAGRFWAKLEGFWGVSETLVDVVDGLVVIWI